MPLSLPIPTPTGPGLTPNTRTEAEAALSYNSSRQTASAAQPQATTPATEEEPTHPLLQARTPSNYQAAAAVANLSYEPPYPSDETAEAVRGNLSRGTTQAVLAKMASSENPIESLLSKRASREGERRTNALAADGVDRGSARPNFSQRQSYNQQDLKRLMSEKMMLDGAKAPSETGYNSVD
jgi:hypothetical protein